jgi:hypothetical protein
MTHINQLSYAPPRQYTYPFNKWGARSPKKPQLTVKELTPCNIKRPLRTQGVPQNKSHTVLPKRHNLSITSNKKRDPSVHKKNAFQSRRDGLSKNKNDNVSIDFADVPIERSDLSMVNSQKEPKFISTDQRLNYGQKMNIVSLGVKLPSVVPSDSDPIDSERINDDQNKIMPIQKISSAHRRMLLKSLEEISKADPHTFDMAHFFDQYMSDFPKKDDLICEYHKLNINTQNFSKRFKSYFFLFIEGVNTYISLKKIKPSAADLFLRRLKISLQLDADRNKGGLTKNVYNYMKQGGGQLLCVYSGFHCHLTAFVLEEADKKFKITESNFGTSSNQDNSGTYYRQFMIHKKEGACTLLNRYSQALMLIYPDKNKYESMLREIDSNPRVLTNVPGSSLQKVYNCGLNSIKKAIKYALRFKDYGLTNNDILRIQEDHRRSSFDYLCKNKSHVSDIFSDYLKEMAHKYRLFSSIDNLSPDVSMTDYLMANFNDSHIIINYLLKHDKLRDSEPWRIGVAYFMTRIWGELNGECHQDQSKSVGCAHNIMAPIVNKKMGDKHKVSQQFYKIKRVLKKYSKASFRWGETDAWMTVSEYHPFFIKKNHKHQRIHSV